MAPDDTSQIEVTTRRYIDGQSKRRTIMKKAEAEKHESMGMKKEMGAEKKAARHESIGMKKREKKDHEKSKGMAKR